MKKNYGHDLISDLPEGIIDTILTKLPIKDAVQTSVLATRWRHRWTTMTHLVFDDEYLVEGLINNFVSKFLFCHNGPIYKFALTSSYYETPEAEDIDPWLLFVSRKDVKELAIKFRREEYYTVPPCLFSFKSLIRLELVRCELKPPPNFKGFLLLKCLVLEEFRITSKDVETLISSCPLLENLQLTYYDSLVLDLIIRAPKLKYLNLEGLFMGIRLANTPHLVDISADVEMKESYITKQLEESSSCHFDDILGWAPKLERLIGVGIFTTYLTVGYGHGVGRRPITYHQLKFIELYGVELEEIKQALIVLQLIVNSPNLEELSISECHVRSSDASASDLQCWDNNLSEGFMLRELKTVWLGYVCDAPLQMRFIRFLLEHSPALEEMTVRPRSYKPEEYSRVLIDLVSFRRASPHASIVCVRI